MPGPFNSRPVAEQQLLLDEIGSIYLEKYRWPAWAYLEEFLERHDLDARAVVYGFPKDPVHNYGRTWPIFVNTQPGTPIGLTIAGLHHISVAAPDLVAMVDAGELHVEVTERLALSELPSVHARADGGALSGKVVLLPAAA
jgi:NADPH:quinone reductase-like Zn-dependent oxidoreductase